MADLHIEEFFGDAARVLVSLYRIFPRPVTLFVEDISGPDEPDEYGVHSHRHQACFATMLFLHNEGFVEYAETIRSEALDQASLSGKALSLLLSPMLSPISDKSVSQNATEIEQNSSLPASVLAEQATAIYQLEHAVKHNDAATTTRIMQYLLADITR